MDEGCKPLQSQPFPKMTEHGQDGCCCCQRNGYLLDEAGHGAGGGYDGRLQQRRTAGAAYSCHHRQQQREQPLHPFGHPGDCAGAKGDVLRQILGEKDTQA